MLPFVSICFSSTTVPPFPQILKFYLKLETYLSFVLSFASCIFKSFSYKENIHGVIWHTYFWGKLLKLKVLSIKGKFFCWESFKALKSFFALKKGTAIFHSDLPLTVKSVLRFLIKNLLINARVFSWRKKLKWLKFNNFWFMHIIKKDNRWYWYWIQFIGMWMRTSVVLISLWLVTFKWCGLRNSCLLQNNSLTKWS